MIVLFCWFTTSWSCLTVGSTWTPVTLFVPAPCAVAVTVLVVFAFVASRYIELLLAVVGLSGPIDAVYGVVDVGVAYDGNVELASFDARRHVYA